MYPRKFRGWKKHADFFIIDTVVLHLALVLAYALNTGSWLYASRNYRILAWIVLASNAFIFLAFYTMENVLKRGFFVELVETVKHCGGVLIMTIVVLFLLRRTDRYSGAILFVTFLLHIAFGYSSRLCWKWIVINYREHVGPKRQVLALLEAETAEKAIEQLDENITKDYEIIGIVLNKKDGRNLIGGVPVVATLEDAAAYIIRKSVDSMYVDCSAEDPAVAELIKACMKMGIPIHYRMPIVYGLGTKSIVEQIGGETVLTYSLKYTTPSEQAAKRALDIAGGLVGSLIALLLILIIGPMIKKASPGPILYAQERVGRNGRRFKMYKLRSMYPDADARKQELMAQNRIADGRMFKLDFDPRVIGNEILPDGTYKTGIGDFIRRTSLDEFPQFFNVLAGEMSLVGTRPPTVDEWRTYEYHHRARLACKPGITGLWQVSGRSEITDFEEVVKLDTQYILNWSFGMDLRILLKTVIVVLRGRGAL